MKIELTPHVAVEFNIISGVVTIYANQAKYIGMHSIGKFYAISIQNSETFDVWQCFRLQPSKNARKQ